MLFETRKIIHQSRMKRFFIACAILVAVASFLLYWLFYYTPIIIFCHIFLISCLGVVIYFLNRFAAYIKSILLRVLIQNFICFSFFLSLSVFYLVTLGSLDLWGKAIELNLLISYIPRLSSLIQTLPFQNWILYLFLIGFFLLAGSIYYFIRPDFRLNNTRYLKTDLIIAGTGLTLFIIFFQPALKIKRYLYAAGEPVLGFIFPKAWHNEAELEGYTKVLFNDGSKEKECLEKIRKEPVHQSNRNILIILVDGLRRDFLSAYGYSRETTPFLDSMVKSNSMIKIEYPFSPSTATVSGVANLFSSKNINDFSFSGLRLMRYMKFKNYNTYAFITGQHSNWYWLANIYKNDCGFFYESKSDLSPDDNDFVMLKKFDETKMKGPFFAYMHLMSVHIMGKKLEAFKRFLPDKIGFNVDKKEALINNYDNGILQVDYVIRQIFKKLQNNGQLKNSTVFIVADHGELFGEDGRWKHSGSIHPDLQSIPMFIYDQDMSWYQNTYSATLLDVAPTIADRLGYPVPGCWAGVSLHQKLTDFEKEFQSGVECDIPFGLLHNRDSVLTMDLLDKDHILLKKYKIKDGKWLELYKK